MHSGGADRRGDAHAGRVYRRVDHRPEGALAMTNEPTHTLRGVDGGPVYNLRHADKCDSCAHMFGPNDARHEVRVPGHADNGRVFCDSCADSWERENDPEGVEADERAWREWCCENMPEHADAQACEEAWRAQTALANVVARAEGGR